MEIYSNVSFFHMQNRFGNTYFGQPNHPPQATLNEQYAGLVHRVGVLVHIQIQYLEMGERLKVH